MLQKLQRIRRRTNDITRLAQRIEVMNKIGQAVAKVLKEKRDLKSETR